MNAACHTETKEIGVGIWNFFTLTTLFRKAQFDKLVSSHALPQPGLLPKEKENHPPSS